MAARKKILEPNIRRTFHSLSDDALIDDGQLAEVASVAPSTVKRWRREGKLPEAVMI